jgi:DNA-directed RNA polymerase II subunit RPB3
MTPEETTGGGRQRIEFLVADKDYAEFRLYNSNVAMANALRRVMISEVPILAIESVIVLENSSSLQDDFLAHRLGLIPLEVDPDHLKGMVFAHECNCDGFCARCSVKLTLDVTVTEQDPPSLSVTSKHLVSKDIHVTPAHFSNDETKDLFKHDDGILIMELGRGETLALECWARKCIGKDHAKYSPCCTATFKHEPKIEVNGTYLDDVLTEDQRLDLVSICPVNIFQLAPSASSSLIASSTSSSNSILLQNTDECIYCNECLQLMEDFQSDSLEAEPPISVIPSDTTFHFKVETTGCLEPTAVVEIALHVLWKKIKTILSSFYQQEEDEGDFYVDGSQQQGNSSSSMGGGRGMFEDTSNPYSF